MQLISINLEISKPSLVSLGSVEFGLAKTDAGTRLVILSDSAMPDFVGERSAHGSKTLVLCPLTSHNAAALRNQLAWLQPRPVGLATSAGMGDRVGLATPGHVRAVRAVGGKIIPIFIQQSIREMARTNRNPQQVMDDATWGMFSEGWQSLHGADADHLKNTADIDACLNAGYTFFTIDPGAHVDNRAETASLDELRELAGALPYEINVMAADMMGKSFDLEGRLITFTEYSILKAAVKYGRALTHVRDMYEHLEQVAGPRPFELEVSVDETEQPTSHTEHVYIASELKRLGVKWVSLAPRYVGRFEKGVDYIGDLDAFEVDFAGHAAIARQFGPYKLSLHSGSDKFSIYPLAARLSGGLIHLKTAGTSYLEALRTLAQVDPDFFMEIYSFAREHYEIDRASYHLSAELDRAPLPEQVKQWTDLLNQFDAREILHATFGSVLTERTASGEFRFHDRFLRILQSHSEEYAANLEKHFIRHLTPFLMN